MPRPHILRHMGDNSSVAIDRVMRGNLIFGMSEMLDYFIETVEDRRMDDNCIDS